MYSDFPVTSFFAHRAPSCYGEACEQRTLRGEAGFFLLQATTEHRELLRSRFWMDGSKEFAGKAPSTQIEYSSCYTDT